MSSISAGTTSGTALVSSGDTSGALQLQVNGTTPSVTLAANGSIGVGSTPGYGTNGQVLTSSGTGSAPTWTTVSAGLSAATQAQMEAASVDTVAATPLNTNWHPGVAKVWIKCDSSGTIQASLNVSSITDSGTGLVTVTIATDFSSADYAIVTGVCASNGTAGSAKSVRLSNSTQPTAGAFLAGYGDDITSNTDPVFWFFSCFGDQA